jgi:hypothetical protein
MPRPCSYFFLFNLPLRKFAFCICKPGVTGSIPVTSTNLISVAL